MITSSTSRLQMLPVAEIRALRILVQLLQSRFDTQLYDVILFGSKARGEATSESDIDVLIIL